MKIGSLALITALAAPGVALSQDVEQFSKHAAYNSMKISPDGEYFAATYPFKDHTRLAVLSAKDFSIQCQFYFRDKESVAGYWWGNDDRLLMTISTQTGQFAQPRWTGELFAGNADCSKREQLFGYRKGSSGERAAFQMVDLLGDDPKHILIASNEKRSQFTDLYKLNIYTGRKRLLERSDFKNNSVEVDHEGNWRVTSSYETERDGLLKAEATGKSSYYYKDPSSGEWEEFSSVSHVRSSAAGATEIVDFTADNRGLILSENIDQSQKALYRFDLDSKEKTLLAKHEVVDLRPLYRAYFKEDGKKVNEIVGAIAEDGVPEAIFFDEDSAYAKEYRGLEAAFPGQVISITSQTRDDSKWVVKVRSDRNPGQFFLYDRTARKVSYLTSTRPWIDDKKMATVKPVSFKARDGLQLHGYLTIPAGMEAKNLPLIIHPHGGPYGPRDHWGFNPETQMYASGGYATLQVNFRGSGGYGREFEDMGYGEWGGTMQDDLTDATRWAIDQGIADKDRICISGASYGGYASLMGVVKEPDLYQCAIGYVGVYDLDLMMNKGNVAERIGWGERYMSQAFGKTKEERDSRSPAKFADKIKAGVFLVHGGKDLQAHYENAHVMADALKKANKPYTWLFKNTEGHGFYDEENNKELYTMMLKFLDEHIGSNAKAN
ncbi:S9 family peptidase [Ferrimonas sediminicola]|uniref:S9 family peptidase n=1 Tax=Ferrimonas sediminicola TaxID=2569538 RepID=A0A4U1BHQ2_9GAMM|nr:S9 family peptidase [Ferrimonas sediminicola]TKB50587.1 S9 family peptidase [Ferrimonas sediminicola]